MTAAYFTMIFAVVFIPAVLFAIARFALFFFFRRRLS
jgi:hypothetical protein